MEHEISENEEGHIIISVVAAGATWSLQCATSSAMSKTFFKPRDPILVEEMCDAFAITIDGERFYFDQEDGKKKLVDVFNKLGLTVKYEEVY